LVLVPAVYIMLARFTKAHRHVQEAEGERVTPGLQPAAAAERT
jgi:hypothetical protein